jgi:Ras-related protein Rab-8A
MYYNSVAGAFICFDLTDEDSFQVVNFWKADLAANAPKNIVTILCGLKLDLADDRRAISSDKAEAFAHKHNMHYMEISSKTGHNVHEAVYKMAYDVNELQRQLNPPPINGSEPASRIGSLKTVDTSGVMNDRVRVKLKSEEKENPYANANEMPMGGADHKKKKCC